MTRTVETVSKSNIYVKFVAKNTKKKLISYQWGHFYSIMYRGVNAVFDSKNIL